MLVAAECLGCDYSNGRKTDKRGGQSKNLKGRGSNNKKLHTADFKSAEHSTAQSPALSKLI